MNAPLIVVGAGIAGLSAALAAAPRQVLLLSRLRPSPESALDSATGLAQGGIAAAIDADDSVAAHIEDTMRAGAGHNDRDAVEFLCTQAPAAIEWLQAQGVAFDRAGDSTLALAREGGHGCARIVHAGGDASGARVLAALMQRVRAARHVRWRSGVDVDGLLLCGTRVAGVRVRTAAGAHEFITGAAVVLATGGIGGLFAATTNPEAAQGRGLALALAANARMRDLEFVQFHPTALAVASGVRLPLLTEALRGVGAVLRDVNGHALMQGAHALADLAPRDIVARRVWSSLQAGRGAFLHCAQLPIDWPLAFPTVLAQCVAHGFDPRIQALPVQAAAHFHMGGIAVDLDGRSSVPGLYAVGEVACNGVHGANRLASNSLLEGVVFGRRVGMAWAALRAGSERRGRTLRMVNSGPALVGVPTTRLRALIGAALGPSRSRATIEAALIRIAADPVLLRSDAGKVGTALLIAAIQRPRNLGAHHWLDAEASTRSRNFVAPAVVSMLR